MDKEKDFLEVFISATGLPENLIRQEVESLIKAKGLDRSLLTIEDLRSIMVSYLQKEILAAKKAYS